MKLLGDVCLWIFVIAIFFSLIRLYEHLRNAETCLSSQYKTTDYKVSDNNYLSCKSASNGYQQLKAWEL